MAKTTGGTRSGSSSNPSGTGGVTVEYLRSNIGSSRQRLAELESSGNGDSAEANNLRTGINIAIQMLERRGVTDIESRLPEGWGRDNYGGFVSPVETARIPYMSPSRDLREAVGILDTRISIGTRDGKIALSGAQNIKEAQDFLERYIAASDVQTRITDLANTRATQEELEAALRKEIAALRRRFK